MRYARWRAIVVVVAVQCALLAGCSDAPVEPDAAKPRTETTLAGRARSSVWKVAGAESESLAAVEALTTVRQYAGAVEAAANDPMSVEGPSGTPSMQGGW